MTHPTTSHSRDLTDEQWVLIGPFLPKLARRKDGRGRSWRENRAVLNGILWILRTGAKIMAITDRQGRSVAVHVESATPHEVTLVHATLPDRFISQLPVRLIGDNAYESDRLDAELARHGVELIAPHRRTRTQRTQDGRPLRRYRRRWKVERLCLVAELSADRRAL